MRLRPELSEESSGQLQLMPQRASARFPIPELLAARRDKLRGGQALAVAVLRRNTAASAQYSTAHKEKPSTFF